MRFKGFLKWGAGAILLLLLASAVLLFTLDMGFLKPAIEQRLSAAAGRNISIDGPLSVQLDRETLDISAANIIVANPDWVTGGDFATIKQLDLQLAPLSLWRGPLHLTALTVDGVNAALIEDADGRTNWQFAESDNAQETASLPILDQLRASTIAVRYESPALVSPMAIRIDTLNQTHSDQGALNVSLSGALNEQPIRFDGTAGPWERLLSGQDIKLEGSGSLAQTTVTGSATFQSLWAPERPVIDIRVEGPAIEALTDVLGIEALGSGPLDVQFSSQPADSAVALQLKGRVGELLADVTATLPSWSATRDAVFIADISGPNFGRWARLGGYPDWPDKPFNLNARVRTPEDSLIIEQLIITLSGAKLALDGTVPAFPDPSGASVTLDIQGTDLKPFEKALGLSEAPAGAFSLKGTVSSRADGSTALALDYGIPVATGRVEGTLGAGNDLIGTQLGVNAQGGDAAAVAAMIGITGLSASPWTVNSGLAVTVPDRVDLSAFKFVSETLNLDLDGHVSATDPAQVFSFTFATKGKRLAAFQGMVGEEPLLGDYPFDASGKITSTAKAWNFSEVKANAGPHKLELSGKLSPAMDEAELTLSLAGTNLNRLLAAPEPARLPEGPYRLEGNISLQNSALEIRRSTLVAGPLSASIQVELPWPVDVSEGRFSVQASGQDIARILPELAGLRFEQDDYNIDLVGAWGPQEITFEKGNIRIGETRLIAQGTVDMPPDLSATNLKIDFSSPDISKLGTFDGSRWQNTPVSLQSNFSGTPNRFKMQSFRAGLGESVVTGNLEIDFQPVTPELILSMTTAELDLRPFQPDPAGAAPPPVEKGARLIPEFVFPMESLKAVNGQFEIRVDRLLLRSGTLSRGLLSGSLRDGNLQVQELGADGFQGRAVLTMSLTPVDTARARLTIGARSTEFIFDQSALTREQKLASPAFKTQAAFEGTGAGLRQAMATLTGEMSIQSTGGQVRQRKKNTTGSQLLAEVVAAISPNAARQEAINISCFAAVLSATEGTINLEPGIAVQSDKLNIFARGKIDLGSEKIDVSFNTKTRTAVDISASELFSPYVKLAGTLASPAVALDAKGTLLSGGAAYLSGGLSILAKKALDKLGGTQDPCAEHLEKAEAQTFPDG